MAGHAQLKFVMTECSKTQIRLARPKYKIQYIDCANDIVVFEIMVCGLIVNYASFLVKRRPTSWKENII